MGLQRGGTGGVKGPRRLDSGQGQVLVDVLHLQAERLEQWVVAPHHSPDHILERKLRIFVDSDFHIHAPSKKAGHGNGHALLRLYADEPLDDASQLDRQFVQVGDIQEGIPIDTLNVFLVAANSGGNKQDALAPVLLLDAPQVFLGCGAEIAVISGLAVGDRHQQLDILRTPCQPLGCIPQSRTIPVVASGGNVHHTVAVIPVNGVELGIGVQVNA